MEDDINAKILLWASSLTAEELQMKVGAANNTKEAVVRAYWKEQGLLEDQPTFDGLLLNE